MSTQREDLMTGLRATPQPAGTPTLAEARSGFAALMAQFPIPDDVRTRPTELGGRPALRFDPTGETRPGLILYFHGGSFTSGSPATATVNTAELVRRVGRPAVSVDYRLAPEHPFPAAVEDAVAAYRQLLDDGVAASSIVVAGDSAGGGLSIALAIAARDAGLPRPAAVVTFSAVTDYTRSGASLTTRNGVDPFFTPEGLAANGELYLHGADPRQPLLSPAVVGDLGGLPPLLLQVGTAELLLDDSVELARRAAAADVDVVLDVTGGVPHVFQSWAASLDAAAQALDRAALFVDQHLPAV